MVPLAVAGVARLNYLVIDTIERVVDFVLLRVSYGCVLRSIAFACCMRKGCSA
jgi:hypothetical protein